MDNARISHTRTSHTTTNHTRTNHTRTSHTTTNHTRTSHTTTNRTTTNRTRTNHTTTNHATKNNTIIKDAKTSNTTVNNTNINIEKNRRRLIAIGEALIDFMPSEIGKPISEVTSFQPAVGGAPANVCGAFSKLGGESALITQLGDDAFGDKIVEELQRWNIDCSYVKRTKEAATSLAFVALKDDGNREFFFCRKPGADMLFSAEDIKEVWFCNGYALHFCSVSLGDFPMKEAHKKAIEHARGQNMLISFDPNLRPALWESEGEMITAVKDFLPYADIVKVSDEELELITESKNVISDYNITSNMVRNITTENYGLNNDIAKAEIVEGNINKALKYLFQGNVKMVIYTKGAKGAEVYTKYAKAQVDGIEVNCVDTTGAGDGFVGAFLYCMMNAGIGLNDIDEMSEEQLQEFLHFANVFCSKSVTKKGAMCSYPTQDKMQFS